MLPCNQINLSGIVAKVYENVITPNNVKVARFVLKHSSVQMESNEPRNVQCRIFCICLENITLPELNDEIIVTGFLSMNSQKNLVLHTQTVKILNKGI